MSQTETLVDDLRALPAADLIQVSELVRKLKVGSFQRRSAAFEELRGCMTEAEARAFQRSIDEAFGNAEVADEPLLD